jgi:hypothetical protein
MTVLQATFSSRKTNRLVFPVLLVISSHQQKALQVAQSAQVATTKLRAASNHASNVAAVRRARGKRVVAQLRATALTVFLASTRMHLHRHAPTAHRVSIKMQRTRHRASNVAAAQEECKQGAVVLLKDTA